MNAKTSGVAESNQVDGTCSKRRVLVVDDHPVVRERLSELIGMEPDLLPCGEAEDAAGALEAIEQTRPDIVIVDLSLKNSCGLELIKDIHIRWPRMPTLVLSVHDEAFYAERAIHAGAKGYVTKH